MNNNRAYSLRYLAVPLLILHIFFCANSVAEAGGALSESAGILMEHSQVKTQLSQPADNPFQSDKEIPEAEESEVDEDEVDDDDVKDENPPPDLRGSPDKFLRKRWARLDLLAFKTRRVLKSVFNNSAIQHILQVNIRTVLLLI